MKPLVIETEVGLALHGDNRFCGASVASLAGKTTLTQALLMATTLGRLSSREAATVLDDLQVCALAADPRIWPLKLVRMGSAHGSALAGVAVGLLGMESDDIGPWVAGRAAEVLLSIHDEVRDGDDTVVDESIGRRLSTAKFHGYGVPFRKQDERVVAFEACLRARGRDVLPYWRLARCIERSLGRHRPLPLNIGGAAAAALLDAGLTAAEVQRATGFGAVASLIANAVEGAEQRSPVLQRLPDECVEYKGPPPRRSPRFREPT